MGDERSEHRLRQIVRPRLAILILLFVGFVPGLLADDPCPFTPLLGTTPISLENFPLRSLFRDGLDRVRRFIPPGFQIFPHEVPDSAKSLLGFRRGEKQLILLLLYDNLCCEQTAYQWEQRIAVIEQDFRGNITVLPILNRDGSRSRHLRGVNTAFNRASQTYFVAVFNSRGTCGASLIKKVGPNYVQVPFSYESGIRDSDYSTFDKPFFEEVSSKRLHIMTTFDRHEIPREQCAYCAYRAAKQRSSFQFRS